MSEHEVQNNPPPGTFRLSQSDLVNPLWLRINEYLEFQLAKLRTENDDIALDAMQTAIKRGHIQFLRQFIALGKIPPPTIDG